MAADPDRDLTVMQSAFLDAYVENRGNVREAMNTAGYSKSVGYKDVVNTLKDEMQERVMMYLAMNGMKAASGLMRAFDEDAGPGQRDRTAAAVQVLDRIGITKKESIEVTGNGGGIFLFPPKDADQDIGDTN